MGSVFRNLALAKNCRAKWETYHGVCCPLTPTSGNPYQVRSFTGTTTIKHNNKKTKPLSSTSIIVQDGISIMEMPCIVQVINGEFEITSNGKTESGHSYVGMGLKYLHPHTSPFKQLDVNEESEMVSGFMRCNSLKEVVLLLTTCPQEEITPSVALAIIQRVFKFESEEGVWNKGSGFFSSSSDLTFARSALMTLLVETICATSEPKVVVDTLIAMGRDPSKVDNSMYLDRVCTESIILATDGKLTIDQVCEVIKAFHNLGPMGKNFSDKVWVGITGNNDKFSADDICKIMSILPLVKNSRNYLYNVVERKLPLISDYLEAQHIIKILYSFIQVKLYSDRLLKLISKWTTLNIHKLTEGNLRWIIASFLNLNYTDENFQNTLSRYMKAKKTNIKDHSLVSYIMNYCQKLGVRHPVVLHIGSEYLIKHGKSMTSSHIFTIVNCLGHLNYTPADRREFFAVVQSLINENFDQFHPSEVLDILFACVYLELYPLDFMEKVFQPDFLLKIHSSSKEYPQDRLQRLKMLDTVLCLLVPSHHTFCLTEDLFAKHGRDDRTQKCINELKPLLETIFGTEERIQESFVLPSTPPTDLFIVDLLIEASTPSERRGQGLALLIQLPEHYDSQEKHLRGFHSLKRRVIESCGYKVLSLDYSRLMQLFHAPTDQLHNFLSEKIFRTLQQDEASPEASLA